jgi:NAD(P)-dependent dehydrogenase (short-subunit alcohol dehydrogenase family)
MSAPLGGTIAISGAGGGLGLGMAVECLRRGEHVLALILDDSQRAGLEEAAMGLPGRLDVQVLDITRPGDFAFPADLSVLVNNAGIRLKNLPVEEIPLDEWRLYFEVNFLGHVELTRRAIPLMRAAGQGLICNINSGSITTPYPFLGPYRATKGAMMAFSETLRTELAPFGIRVLEILPGAVRTGINKESVTQRVAHAADYPPYAPMAQRQREVFSKANFQPLEIEEATRGIVDKFYDNKGRMRHGTCAASDAALNAWRPEGGEAGMAAFVKLLLPEG